MPDHLNHQFSPFSALAAAAAATKRLRIGAFVFANDYRHPLMLAREAATLDVLSGRSFRDGPGRRLDDQRLPRPGDELRPAAAPSRPVGGGNPAREAPPGRRDGHAPRRALPDGASVGRRAHGATAQTAARDRRRRASNAQDRGPRGRDRRAAAGLQRPWLASVRAGHGEGHGREGRGRQGGGRRPIRRPGAERLGQPRGPRRKRQFPAGFRRWRPRRAPRRPSTAVRTSCTGRSGPCGTGCCGAAMPSASATTRSPAARWSRWRRWSRLWRANSRAPTRPAPRRPAFATQDARRGARTIRPW